MSYKCKFCGKEYDCVYDRMEVLCCNEGFLSKGTSALILIKEDKK